jgi:hypothetical protein
VLDLPFWSKSFGATQNAKGTLHSLPKLLLIPSAAAAYHLVIPMRERSDGEGHDFNRAA